MASPISAPKGHGWHDVRRDELEPGFIKICPICRDRIEENSMIVNGDYIHIRCLTCSGCRRQLSGNHCFSLLGLQGVRRNRFTHVAFEAAEDSSDLA
jgi:hypothetical protein